MVAPPWLDRLARLDSCALSDALDSLGLHGVADGLGPLTGPARVAGRVVTVELGRPGAQRSHRHLCTAAVVGAEPGDVIVVAHQGRTDCAGWGGNLSRAAGRAGLGGVIVDGAARDIDESREVGFPVFASAATPRTARGRAVEVSWGEPVSIAGVAVAAGDAVLADGTGVVFVPAGRLDEVLAVAEQIAAKEAAMASAIAAGTPVDQVMGADYEHLLHRAPGGARQAP